MHQRAALEGEDSVCVNGHSKFPRWGHRKSPPTLVNPNNNNYACGRLWPGRLRPARRGGPEEGTASDSQTSANGSATTVALDDPVNLI